MVALSSHKQELLVRLDYLVGQTKGMDFIISDDTGNFSIDDELVKRIRTLVRQAAELMLAIMNCYDAEADVTSEEIPALDDEDFLKEIGAQISSQLAVEEVSGLAFVSRGQLLDIVAAIDAGVEAGQIWEVASHLDSGLRRTGRALVAIESAMRECEGLPVEYRQWHNLDDSLEVRRIYGEFRRSVLRGSGEDPDRVPPAKELATKLWHASERIAVLRGREIYPYLRIDDRLQIRRLQKRILEWLDQGGADLERGARMWSDLVSFARLLGQVNHREELREHDRLAVDALYRRFFEADAVPALTSENLSLLKPLLGREDDLDKIILNPADHAGKDLQEPLERLHKELGRPFEVPSHSDFSHPIPG